MTATALVKTASDHNDHLTRFLAEELARADRYQCERIELVYAPRDARAETQKTWTREESPDLFASLAYVSNIVADVIDKCEKYADDAGPGKYRFILRTHQAGGGRQSTTIVIEPSQDSAGTDALSGPLEASPTGVLGQQMRNNEFLTRMLKEMMQGTVGVLNRQLMDSLDRINVLEAENQKLREQINANKNAEAQREMDIVREGRAADRMDMIVGKAVQLAPVVITGMMGDKLAGGAANGSALGSIINTLGASLVQDPKRVQSIMMQLSLQERVLFQEAIRVAQLGAASPSPTPSGTAANGDAGNSAGAASPHNGVPQPAPSAPTEKG